MVLLNFMNFSFMPAPRLLDCSYYTMICAVRLPTHYLRLERHPVGVHVTFFASGVQYLMQLRLQGCAAASLVAVHLLLKVVAAVFSAIVKQVWGSLPSSGRPWQTQSVFMHQQETMGHHVLENLSEMCLAERNLLASVIQPTGYWQCLEAILRACPVSTARCAHTLVLACPRLAAHHDSFYAWLH